MVKFRYKQLCLTCRLRVCAIHTNLLHSWFRSTVIHPSVLCYPLVVEWGVEGVRLLCISVEYVLSRNLKWDLNRCGAAKDGLAPISERESQKDPGHMPAVCHDYTQCYSLFTQKSEV